MSKRSETIMVALSGGVDSAVAALSLLRQGLRVEGLHMTNWDDDDGYCSAAADYQDARRVCIELGIPLHRVNFSAEYRDQVFAHFLAEYACRPHAQSRCSVQSRNQVWGLPGACATAWRLPPGDGSLRTS